jgi:hypothetical protein
LVPDSLNNLKSCRLPLENAVQITDLLFLSTTICVFNLYLLFCPQQNCLCLLLKS